MFHTLLIFDNFAIKQILFYFELTVIQKNYLEKTHTPQHYNLRIWHTI